MDNRETQEMALTLCIGFETALLYWRAVHAGFLPHPQETALTRLPERCVASLSDLRKVDLTPLGVKLTDQGISSCYKRMRVNWGPKNPSPKETLWHMVPCGIGLQPGESEPIQVLTSRRGQRHPHGALKAHLMERAVPSCSFYRVSPSILVVSPELAFIQMCQMTHMMSNIELGLELCGSYALLPADLPCRYDRKPIMSAERIRRCLVEMGRMRGAPAARVASSWIADGMASPRESGTYLLMVLPAQIGGYGLIRPEINARVDLHDSPLKVTVSPTYYVVDMIWRKKMVVLEYDGFDDHESTPEKVAADKERRSILAALGYTVIVITRRDLETVLTLRAKLEQVAAALDINLHVFDEREALEHRILFDWLTNPLHDQLPFGRGYH